MGKTGQFLGSMASDKNRDSVQVSGSFVTADNTGTPQTSPLSLTTTAVFTIVVPDTAIIMTCMSAADMRISEVVGMGQYDLIKANTKESIQCARMANIYVKNDVTGTNNFYFKFYSL